MSHRLVFLVLLALLAIVHAQLWFGSRSLPSVHAMQRQLDEQRTLNEQARQTNEQLTVELEDLQTSLALQSQMKEGRRLNVEQENLQNGLSMVEERARTEMNMIRPNEIFVQISNSR